ncbi:hypothetical protein [Actinomadura sp. 9N407]|uniref:hypothetical protein n=1 Tax=Actinomadura sp. 9N407 TaxID=3375154 RepID=UPI00378C2E99
MTVGGRGSEHMHSERGRMTMALLSRWAPIVVSALASAVSGFCLLLTLMLLGMTPWYRGETGYCTPPDHAGPCDRIQEMSTGSATILAVVVLALSGAAFAALIYGWTLTLGERRVRGTVIILAAALGPAAAFGLMVYGHSPA